MSETGILLVYFAKALNLAFTICFWIIFARALFSWIRPNPYNPVIRLVYRLVDPVTDRIRRMLPTRVGMIDFAPFILMIAIMVIQELLTRLLLQLALRV
jgi:YggT family protein